jgi:cell wall-associated NlpC family hydrolase
MPLTFLAAPIAALLVAAAPAAAQSVQPVRGGHDGHHPWSGWDEWDDEDETEDPAPGDDDSGAPADPGSPADPGAGEDPSPGSGWIDGEDLQPPGIGEDPADELLPPGGARPVVKGREAKLGANGAAYAPSKAPGAVKRAIWAANQLRKKPYKWGGGHGGWKDSGYDCSGSVSYILHAAGLLSSPQVSGTFARYGKGGKGKWISIYANKGHVFMVVAGMRFDTSPYGSGARGPRWRLSARPAGGFKVRHPAGF